MWGTLKTWLRLRIITFLWWKRSVIFIVRSLVEWHVNMALVCASQTSWCVVGFITIAGRVCTQQSGSFRHFQYFLWLLLPHIIPGNWIFKTHAQVVLRLVTQMTSSYSSAKQRCGYVSRTFWRGIKQRSSAVLLEDNSTTILHLILLHLQVGYDINYFKYHDWQGYCPYLNTCIIFNT